MPKTSQNIWLIQKHSIAYKYNHYIYLIMAKVTLEFHGEQSSSSFSEVKENLQKAKEKLELLPTDDEVLVEIKFGFPGSTVYATIKDWTNADFQDRVKKELRKINGITVTNP